MFKFWMDPMPNAFSWKEKTRGEGATSPPHVDPPSPGVFVSRHASTFFDFGPDRERAPTR
jgi:hypothetical protein